MTRSLMSFVDFGKASPHGSDDQPTLPTNAAIVFFEDKHLDEIKARLEHERDKNHRMVMTLADLAAVLREVWSDPEGSEPVPEVSVSLEEPMVEAAPVAPLPTVELGLTPATGVEVEPNAILPATTLPDLQDLFSPTDVKRFVKSIFHKDDAAFRTALDDLNRFTAWEDASHFLDDLFVLQNIDPFSEEAVEFTDRVYARYFPGGA
jgi:hypothetical protein